MVSRAPDGDVTPAARKEVKGFALHVAGKKPGGAPTMLGLLVAPSPQKLQELLDFLRTCPPITVSPAMLSGADVSLTTPGA